MRCSYCAQTIAESADFLECEQCQANVHVKCLRTCRPGDLLGDVFFDFTCAECTGLQSNVPTTSSYAKMAPREKLVRQRLSWFMVVTLALYNLAIKSKGIGYHGYFHWRSHIVSFVNKHWDYFFEPTTKRRKNWFGSISGNLSHYSPEFFSSGQGTIKKLGWWKLSHHNCTPRAIFKKYEEHCQQRAQQRYGKRSAEDNHINDLTDLKRTRRTESEDDSSTPIGGCSRTIPYMGRKPKVAKQLNIVDDDISKSLMQQQEQPLSMVQSSLMDFLAESLGNDDLNMFNHLPNIAAEPLDDGDERNDFLPLLEPQVGSGDLFDVPDIKCNFNFNSDEPATNDTMDGKGKSFYEAEQQQQQQQQQTSESNSLQITPEDSLQTPSEYSNDGNDEDEFQPRILQVTNFQQLNNAANVNQLPDVPSYLDKEIKTELRSDAEQSDNEEITVVQMSTTCNGTVKTEPADSDSELTGTTPLQPCKPSLFTKHPRRNLPWLEEDAKEAAIAAERNNGNESNNLVMISEYEETQMLEKLRKVFALEVEHKLEIPSYIRRYYRKLCVREWKRQHGRPLFNLDDAVNGVQNSTGSESKSKIIDRYQLISLSTGDKRKSFYARIAGASEYELFESPYTHRILKPFIYRNKVCFPPWVKLMCELQQKVNRKPPTRAPIDYCYVRPNHIAAVNALLQSSFWPDIDMSECLSYPDYSVVALYKKLVIGCGFLVPDVGFNEAYISFMAVRPCWQRCGIGTFMLYHLIQTCMSKDITLHVSATNPAVVLYQKFGFKIEEVILDFYEKYLPAESKQSRTAFFLRLMR